jgi:hypothetical protein
MRRGAPSSRRGAAPRASQLLAGVVLALASSSLLGVAADPAPAPVETVRVPLPEAKRLVRMMDDIYFAGVLATHSMYVQEPGVPAAVTWAKQVIAQVKKRGWPDARIFATVDRPLNPENHPVDDFEREATAAFRKGQPHFEKVEGDTLRYATELRLVDKTCVTCHVKGKPGDLVGGVSYKVLLKQP